MCPRVRKETIYTIWDDRSVLSRAELQLVVGVVVRNLFSWRRGAIKEEGSMAHQRMGSWENMVVRRADGRSKQLPCLPPRTGSIKRESTGLN